MRIIGSWHPEEGSPVPAWAAHLHGRDLEVVAEPVHSLALVRPVTPTATCSPRAGARTDARPRRPPRTRRRPSTRPPRSSSSACCS